MQEGRSAVVGRGRKVAIAALAIGVSSGVAGGVFAATQSSDEAALQPTRQGASASIERKVNDLVRKMTVDEKLQQVQLLSDGQINDDEAMAGVGGVFSLDRPGEDRPLPAPGGREDPAGIPILFAYDTIHGYHTIFPIPLGAASSFDPAVATADDTIGAARVGRGRHQADLQPDGRRLARAALGPHLRGRRRGPVPELGVRRRARQGRAGHRLQRARQGGHERQALRRLRPARGWPRLQHHRHVRAAAAQPVPAAVQGRDRRGRRHGHVLVQRHQRRAGLRQPLHGDRHPQEGVGLRRVHRERHSATLPRRPSTANPSRAAPAPPPTIPTTRSSTPRGSPAT